MPNGVILAELDRSMMTQSPSFPPSPAPSKHQLWLVYIFSESFFLGGRAEAFFFLDLVTFFAERFVEGGTGEPCIPALLLDAALGRWLNFFFLCPLTFFGRTPFPFLAVLDASGNTSVAVILDGIIKNNVWYCRVKYAPCGELIRGVLVVGAS